MKLLGKIKNLFSKKQKASLSSNAKIVISVMFVIGNLGALTIATMAWFNIDNGESKIAMVSGDLDVEINKVTAYKYVYPYYKNSTEFINYDTDGVVKKYVLEDHVSTFDDVDYDDIEITSDNATINLNTRAVGTVTTNPALATPTNVCIPTPGPNESVYRPDFRYYLIGDGLFCGVDDDESWMLENSYAFAKKNQVAPSSPAVLDNVVVSAGSSFALLEVLEPTANTFSYNYFSLNNIVENKSPFRIVDSNGDGVKDSILCLRSGIYTFTYQKVLVDEVECDQLRIDLHTRNSGATKDISVITNNSFDPTKVTIDYAGSVNKTDPEGENYFEHIEDYLSTAIFNQNTTLILDIELNFKNANPVDASLKIERTEASSNSINNISGKYSNKTRYLNDSTLRSSDFYNFYAIFTKTPYTDLNDDDGDDSDDLWKNLHRIGDSDSQRFLNGSTYDRTIDCPLNLKDNVNDSTTIPGTNPNGLAPNIYHCYVAIEYDYVYCNFFLDKNRLGKTYILDRDFGFHFSCVQHKEEDDI